MGALAQPAELCLERTAAPTTPDHEARVGVGARVAVRHACSIPHLGARGVWQPSGHRWVCSNPRLPLRLCHQHQQPTCHPVCQHAGFDNIEPLIGYDNNVLNKYFNEYLPRAVSPVFFFCFSFTTPLYTLCLSPHLHTHHPHTTHHQQASIAADMQRQSPSGDRYIYTTHSWLLSLFLDCPQPGPMDLRCPNTTTRAAVLDAIHSGAITWHAHPHNAQYELYDPSLLRFSFQLTHDLDRRFGFAPKHTAILVRLHGGGEIVGWLCWLPCCQTCAAVVGSTNRLSDSPKVAPVVRCWCTTARQLSPHAPANQPRCRSLANRNQGRSRRSVSHHPPYSLRCSSYLSLPCHRVCVCAVLQRDVPGLTRAVIPIFVAAGIKAISVGVNAGSAPPGVPKYQPFVWRDEASDTQILAFWHPGGWGLLMRCGWCA